MRLADPSSSFSINASHFFQEYSVIRRFLLLVASFVLLSACAVAPGPVFSTIEPVAQSKGNLYLYRKSALYAAGAKYAVKADSGAVVGELYNGSYLLLSLGPGKHGLPSKKVAGRNPGISKSISTLAQTPLLNTTLPRACFWERACFREVR